MSSKSDTVSKLLGTVFASIGSEKKEKRGSFNDFQNGSQIKELQKKEKRLHPFTVSTHSISLPKRPTQSMNGA